MRACVCVLGRDEEVVGDEKRFLGKGSAEAKAEKCWAPKRGQTISGAQGRSPPPEQSWGTRKPEGRGVLEQARTSSRDLLVSVSS